MMRSLLLTGGLLAVALLVPALRAQDDDLRLRLPAASGQPADTRTLGLTAADEDAELIDTRFRAGFVGFRGGFYRPVYYYGGFYRPVYYYGGFYRPAFYYGGFYRPAFYYGGFYRGVGFGYGFGGFYSVPFVNYGFFPCSVTEATPVTTLEYRIKPLLPAATQPTPSKQPMLPRPNGGGPPPMPQAEGTYEYNGGPTAPVPMPPMPPATERDVMNLPRIPTPIIERYVSIRPEPTTGKYVYPAYGEQPRRSGQ